jgi:hypothetical protein
MATWQSWLFWPDNTLASVLVLALIALPFLYGARIPVHATIRSLSRLISNPLRITARWLLVTAQELRARNQIVLLAHGREEVGKAIEREFERIAKVVQRDLHGYPALQRKLMDEITRIEEDYKKCGEVPMPPPEWTKAVAVIAEIKPSGDGLVEKILDDISASIDKIYNKVVAEYRRSYGERHKILKGFMPFWRSVDRTLTRVDQNLTSLQVTASRIDAQIDRYKEIKSGADKVEHALTSSATNQFIISGLVMLIAIGGAFVNFLLIERPMSAMVGGGDYILGNVQTSQVAAMVIIFFETLMGLFLMESMRFTHLFPLSNIDERMRQRMVWISFTILLILAGVEVALAVMRDLIVSADVALKQTLGGGAAVAAGVDTWVTKIPAAGQMILGFILPFALAFVAIPLEYFIYSARTVSGALLVMFIRGLALFARTIASAAKQAGHTLIMLYDVIIFLPLVMERIVKLTFSPRVAALPSSSKSGDVAAFPKRTGSASGDHTL